MNKKISYGCLALCMALYSVDGFAASRNANRSRNSSTATGASRTVSTSLISGYGDKFFKNPSITLIEKRSVELEPLMFTNNLDKVRKTMKGSNTYEPSYKICIPCTQISLEYEVNGTLMELKGGNGCYSLEPVETGATNYKLTTASGAIEACGEKLRMTVNDIRSSAAPEIDSVVLNVLPNSSAYDYSNIQLGQDTEIYDLIDNYNNAKNEAKEACSNGMDTLKKIKGLLIGSTASSGVATLTGAADTTIQTIKTATNNNSEVHSPNDEEFATCYKNKLNNEIEECSEDNKEECENKVKEKVISECKKKKSKDLYDDCVREECNSYLNSNDVIYSKYESCEKECQRKSGKLTGTQKVSAALSVASGVGNLANTVTSFVSVAEIDKVIGDLKDCKAAATKMHNAGIALEAGLEEIMSAD